MSDRKARAEMTGVRAEATLRYGLPARRLALQLAQQMPLDRGEALLVLQGVRCLIDDRSLARGEPLPPELDGRLVRVALDPDLREMARQLFPQMPNGRAEALEVLRHARVLVDYITREDIITMIPPFSPRFRERAPVNA